MYNFVGIWPILEELLSLEVIAILRDKMKTKKKQKTNDGRVNERIYDLKSYIQKIAKVDDMVHALTMKLYGTFKSVTLITAMNNECI